MIIVRFLNLILIKWGYSSKDHFFSISQEIIAFNGQVVCWPIYQKYHNLII